MVGVVEVVMVNGVVGIALCTHTDFFDFIPAIILHGNHLSFLCCVCDL